MAVYAPCGPFIISAESAELMPVVNAPMHIVDWYPTLLKLAGGKLEQKTNLDGRDCWGALTRTEIHSDREILINAAPRAGAIRMGDWKLVVNGGRRDTEETADGAEENDGAEQIELFNLRDDPSEAKNVAQMNPEKLRELRARYDAYAKAQVPPKIRPKPRDFRVPKIWGEKD